MLPSEIIKQVKRIQVRTGRQVADVLAGEYLSVFKGRGMEFDEVRPYIPGDDVRTIDWNVTARTGAPFVKRFVEAGKPVGVICHGPWTLIEAGVVKGRTMTSWPSLKTDLINAGAKWVDQEVVVDRGIVSSRKPADIPAFVRKFIEEIEKGTQSGSRETVAHEAQRE